MIENINKMLETNDVMVLIDSTWYRLEEIHTDSVDSMPIIVSDDDGEDYEFDMADIDEFNNSELMDPIFILTGSNIVGVA